LVKGKKMIVYSTYMGTKTGTFPIIKLKAPGLKLNFTTRVGGVSKPPFDSLNLGSGIGDDEGCVHTNRDIIFRTLGINKDRVASAVQIHSSRVVVTEKAKMVRNCDGLITGHKNLTLVVSTADCYPVILYSPSDRALALLHVGRKGAGSGIIQNALKILVSSYRINTSHTLAFFGP
jgi:copper oxidase (laccase) domain-containing protein